MPKSVEWNDAVARVVRKTQSDPFYLINDGASALMLVFDAPWRTSKEAILDALRAK